MDSIDRNENPGTRESLVPEKDHSNFHFHFFLRRLRILKIPIGILAYEKIPVPEKKNFKTRKIFVD